MQNSSAGIESCGAAEIEAVRQLEIIKAIA